MAAIFCCCAGALRLFLPSPTLLPSPSQLLRRLPANHPRGLALQQFGAAVLLERLLPAGRVASKSAVPRREPSMLDPSAVIAAQPWFTDGKGLAEGATTGAKQARSGLM